MSLKDDILREAVNKVHGDWDLDDHLLRRQRSSWNIERIRGCSGLPVSGRETLSLEVVFGDGLAYDPALKLPFLFPLLVPAGLQVYRHVSSDLFDLLHLPSRPSGLPCITSGTSSRPKIYAIPFLYTYPPDLPSLHSQQPVVGRSAASQRPVSLSKEEDLEAGLAEVASQVALYSSRHLIWAAEQDQVNPFNAPSIL